MAAFSPGALPCSSFKVAFEALLTSSPISKFAQILSGWAARPGTARVDQPVRVLHLIDAFAFSYSSRRDRPQLPNIRECRKYWLMAVELVFQHQIQVLDDLRIAFHGLRSPTSNRLTGNDGPATRQAHHPGCAGVQKIPQYLRYG